MSYKVTNKYSKSGLLTRSPCSLFKNGKSKRAAEQGKRLNDYNAWVTVRNFSLQFLILKKLFYTQLVSFF